jgi:hypothetical protein
MIAVGIFLAVVALGAVLQSPLRRWVKSTMRTRVFSQGRFDNPEGLAIDAQGTFYVGCQTRSNFFILDRTGKTVKEIRELEGYRSGAGKPQASAAASTSASRSPDG